MSARPHPMRWSRWGAPVAMALLTAVGLIGGLVGDGAWNALTWVGLGIPVAVCIVYACPRRPDNTPLSSQPKEKTQ